MDGDSPPFVSGPQLGTPKVPSQSNFVPTLGGHTSQTPRSAPWSQVLHLIAKVFLPAVTSSALHKYKICRTLPTTTRTSLSQFATLSSKIAA
jgi:hypothetical protein